jgi:hypothetical protein
MIQTGFESRVKVQQVIESQLPNFILDESPNTAEFLKQYYISQEYQGGVIDIAENLDQYLKLDNLTPEVIVDSVRLSTNISSSSGIVTVTSTKGFPQTYGLLKIDDEIITYTGITTNTFTGCIRGFSGIVDYHKNLNQEELVFSESEAASHNSGVLVQNLSSLFLKEFYKKLKYTFTPGLEEYDFVSNLNVGNFIKEARSFYQSKGTDESFRILFNVLYGVTPQVVNLENFLIKPSSAEFIRREVLIAERISGDPSKLVGQTLKKLNDENTSASISGVEIFTRNNIPYFKISLFVGYENFSAILGNFTITPNTKCLTNVSIGSLVISVDSTIGFPEKGAIVSGNNKINYTSKSINQFFGCVGITSAILSTDNIRSDEIYFGYEDGDLNKKVELRLSGVLSKFLQVSDTLNLDEGQIISVKNIGDLIQNPQNNKTYKEIFANSWIYNTSSRYEIENINNFTLKSPIDRSSLKIGDQVEILKRDTNIVVSSSGVYISNIVPAENRVDINNNSGFSAEIGAKYDLRRKINTANSEIVPIQFGNNVIISDIQNLYTDTDNEYAYIASNSLPSGRDGYTGNFTYRIKKDIKTSVAVDMSDIIDNNYTSIVFQNNVPFISGDRIYYQPSGTPIAGLDTGDYYIQVLDSPDKIRVFSSRSFVGTDNFLTFGLDSIFNSQNQHKFTLYYQKSGIIGAQKLLKKFPLSQSIDTGTGELTIPGPIGMLINGVEIVNYKSDDKVYYGPLKSINVLNGGNDYDVINPPLLVVSAGLGDTALVRPVIRGSIKKVYIDSQDYDINTIVSIGITGGNGSDCVLEPIITKRKRDILFDGRLITNSGGISSITNQLSFITDHNLSNGEAIVYNSNDNLPIGIGTANLTLVNNSTYYPKIDNNRTIRLYQSNSDYQSGINTVKFNGFNAGGIHKFSTALFKNTISEIKVLNGGSGYTNRKLIVSSAGISTSNHTINFQKHEFESGELVTYQYETSTIGISTLSQYYVLRNNDDSFRLCDAGIGGTNISNYNRKNYVRFSSTGSGYQYFSYPDISVSIKYTPVGFGTTTQQVQSLVATPVVKGNIIDAYLYEGGTGYGSTILNLEKKPSISIKNGREASLKPIIINGQINSVNIESSGNDYYSTPDLIVTDLTGSGSGADLRPVIINQRITDVKVINAGIGYSSSSTAIQVKPVGSGAILDANIRDLTVNHNVKFGDEILRETENQLQYSVCGYFKDLRDSFNDNEFKVSTIIGWAYDGNPIYGSYGYSNPKDLNTSPKRLISGYVLNSSNISDRPNSFSSGFFVEDYQYTNSGDLDENNGRFGKTPEFPDGIYAYFSTLDTSSNPTFPYFIGNRYRSNTIKENSTLNQKFDFNNSNLLRNTLPYKVSDDYAKNDFVNEVDQIAVQEAIVESVSEGFISGFDIVNSGSNYKVNDVLNFDDSNTSGGGLISRVSSIEGKDIVKIDTSVETYENAIFTYENGEKVKVTIKPNHNLSNNDFVVISGFSTNLSKLNNSYKIAVSSYYSNVLKDIPTTSTSGLTTEIYVTQLPTKVSVASSISIGEEILSILEVYKNLNILKVQRGSTGVSHTATTQINFIPDSFIIPQKTDYFESKVNNKVFFNSVQSVGVGITPGITITKTFKFGDSNITRTIPTQGIYIENHPFSNNQKVLFNGPGTILISTSPTSGTFPLPQNVYVTNKNINTIGIKTSLNSSEVFFRTNGDTTGINGDTNGNNNNKYSFQSTYPQIIGKVERIKSVVSVSTSHELSNEDNIKLTVEPNLSVGIGASTSIYTKRDLITGNILINPISFNSSGINTETDTISINSHNLKTGDKVLYSSNSVASGLSTGFYYVYRVNDNSIKLCETYIDSETIPPAIVGINSTGGSNQSISLINPQIISFKNNNLVFNLSDNSLVGYNFKIYYDKDYKNEFTPTQLSRIGSIGVSNNASIAINYDNNIPTRLYYNLEKSGYISTSDKEVNNYSEILFVGSVYNSNYKISGVGNTTFNISLSKKPEKLTYTSNECDKLQYTTNSLSAKGPIDKINIISGGSGYKKLPTIKGSNSLKGKDAYIIPKSTSIGNAKEVRIIDEGFQYSSDKTLKPIAAISPLITIKNSNTIDSISVTNGGRGYTDAPSIVVVNTETGEEINSGILEATLSGNTINLVNIIQKPKGIPEAAVEIFATNNSNGISIEEVESNSTGRFICYLRTPIFGFSTPPFNIGDKVFIEGIQKSSITGTGFNSKDYGYKFFEIDSIDTTGPLDSVTIDISKLTTNTGIANIIQDSVATIIKITDYPSFNINKIPSSFNIGEKLISDGIERDLKISSYQNSFIKVSGRYELTAEEVIIGKESGNIATIDNIKPGFGIFNIDYSIEKNIGWSNDIGKLGQDNQVIPDNDYYQNLSYTIKSPITYQQLKTPVNSLVHSSGLKNFSDTGITSTANSGITTSENATTIFYDIVEESRVDTIYDFDLVKNIDIVASSDGSLISQSLKLKNKKLTDYVECRSNVVLKVDNINRQFSDVDGSPSNYSDLLELNSEESYFNLLISVTSFTSLNTIQINPQVQLSELILLNTGSNTFLAEKSTTLNAGVYPFHLPEESIGEFLVEGDYLRFVPKNAFDTDYDIKIINTNFNLNSGAASTISVGFIDLIGPSITIPAGIQTSSILSVPVNKFSSLYSNIQIIDSLTNQMNFVEVYLTHDGIDNSYISEYYFDSEFSSNFYSGNRIGIFTSSISSSGILSLDYISNSPNLVNIRSKVVGFGATSIGSGVYRFLSEGELAEFERSAKYESTFTSTSLSPNPTIISLNTVDFNAVKSLVEVSVGSTSVLHQIMMVQDETNIYVQQLPFLSIGSTTGIGTFGGEYLGDNFILKFYPDPSVNSNVKISSLNMCLYTFPDIVNIPPSLNYGNVTEFIDIKQYNSINGERINRTNFELRSNNVPIFAKRFNPINSQILNSSTGVFTIRNHFFSNLEKLIYTPKSTFINVSASEVGIGLTLNSVGVLTTKLPSEVYAIRLSDDTFKLSTRKDYASLGIGVTFTSYGSGNSHQLEMDKKLEKSLITIDNIVQYPLIFTPISYNLSGNGGQIGAGSSVFALSGISTIVPKDILKIDNEYMGVINVGLGTTNIGPISNSGNINLVEVKRRFVGSSASTHSDSSSVRIYKGSYNIVDSSIFFAESPRGNPQIIRDSSNLTFETSDFTGRVFLRNNYTSNQLYDDISNQFTGIGRTFTLTVGGANTVGLGTSGGNGILLINGVFQTPTTINNPENNFSIIETFTGNFVGIATTTGNVGINTTFITGITTTGIAVGQIVGVSTIVGSGTIVTGIGTVNVAGIAITSVFISSTTLNTNVQTGIAFTFGKNTAGISSVVFSGIRNPQTLQIITSEYDVNQNQTPRGGIIISLGSSTGLGYAPLVGAKVLPRINSSGEITSIVSTATTGSAFAISTATYYNTTGLFDVTTTTPHGFEYTNVREVTLIGLKFSCASAHIGVTTTIFPEGVTGIGKTFAIKAIGTTTSFTIDVGISTIPHNYVGQGTVFSWYGDLTSGSGYNGIVAIGVSVYESDHTGAAATITANVGAGGTLGFTIVGGGSGYTNPKIFVSEPSYENLDVIGISRLGIGATTDTGIGLLLNVEVGASSTTGIGSTYFEVSRFSISRQGYSFRRGDVFKPVGLVTAKGLASPLSEFRLTVVDTFSDSFAAWQFGEFDYIDSIKRYQNGIRRRFPLFYNNDLLSFEALEDSQINLSNILLIVINGVIQDPEIAYEFEGGSSFIFTTAPKSEDNISIFFYKGTDGDDVIQNNTINETLKIGDIVQVLKNNSFPRSIAENKRTIFDIKSSDKITTSLYSAQELDSEINKPLSWIKQKVDREINGETVYKARDSIESLIYPTAKIIKDFSSADTTIFVDNIEFFEYDNITPEGNIQRRFSSLIVNGSPDPVSGDVTAVVSAAGTIQSLLITNPGSGYNGSSVSVKISAPASKFAVGYAITGSSGIVTDVIITYGGYQYNSPPNVIFKTPKVIGVGIGTIAVGTANITNGIVTSVTLTNPGYGYSSSTEVTFSSPEVTTATATAFISNGALTGVVSITNPGFGYSSLNPPKVIVPLPNPIYENITQISSVDGFSGIITGITTTTGSNGNPLALRFYLNSPDYTGLQTGYPIYIFDTRIGNGVTSIDSSNSAVVGIGTTFVDNVYYIHEFSSNGTITCNVRSNTSVVGLSSSGSILNPVGKYSWGRLSGFTRSSSPISIGVSGNTVDVGLSTFPTIQRRGIGIRQTGALPKLL